MARQVCPNCLKRVDVGIYVSGRKVRCPRCRVPFVVKRDSLPPTPVEPPLSRRSLLHAEAKTTPSRPLPALRADGRPVSLAEAAAPPPRDAPEIPGYRIEAVLGQGAMGTVYRASRIRDGQVVALKMLAEQLQTNPEFVARFEREIAALAAVRHPCVVELIEMSQVGEQRYFAMEYVDGTSLRAEYAVTKPVPSRVVAILKAVVEGLVAAHEAGVIHRDLKPENVVVTPDGGVRIVDFGLAGLFGDGDPHPNLTRSRITMGTVNYMAPEQRTDAKYVDQRADIYAIGVMLYEGLTGELPLGRFQYLNERGFKIPLLADTILSQALAKSPDDRYPDARSLLEDLTKLEKLLRTAALADTAPPRTRSPVIQNQVSRRRRSLRQTVLEPGPHRWTLIAGGVLILAGVGFGLGWRWLSRAQAYEVVVEASQAVRRVLQRTRLDGPSLGLSEQRRAGYDVAFGHWRVEGSSVVHQAVDDSVHLQPTFASALMQTERGLSEMRLELSLRRETVPAGARQLARESGFIDEARLDLPVRAGIGFGGNGQIVGGFIDSDGTCGYFVQNGRYSTVRSQVCGSGGDQRARLRLWWEGEELQMEVDDLRLDPFHSPQPMTRGRPALLCQNARCRFSSAPPAHADASSAGAVGAGGLP